MLRYSDFAAFSRPARAEWKICWQENFAYGRSVRTVLLAASEMVQFCKHTRPFVLCHGANFSGWVAYNFCLEKAPAADSRIPAVYAAGEKWITNGVIPRPRKACMVYPDHLPGGYSCCCSYGGHQWEFLRTVMTKYDGAESFPGVSRLAVK